MVEITYDFLSHLNSVEFGLWLCRILGEKLIRTLNIKRSKPEKTPGVDEKTVADEASSDQQKDAPVVKEYFITKKQEVFEILKDKRNFIDMSETLLKRLLDYMKVYRFEKNKTIFIEGDTVKSFYIIIKGGVSQYMNNTYLI